MLDLSDLCVDEGMEISDFHAALQALPKLRILTTNVGTNIAIAAGSYFDGMPRHLSLEYVAYPVCGMQWMDSEMVEDVKLSGQSMTNTMSLLHSSVKKTNL